MSNLISSFFYDVKSVVKGTLDKKLSILIILSISFALGIILGIAIEPTEFIYNYFLENARNYYCAVMMKDSEFINLFFERIFINFGYFLLVFAFGFSIYLFPLTIIITIYRGYILSFTIAVFSAQFSLTGALIAIFLIVPQNVIVSVCLSFCSASSFYLKDKKCGKSFIKKYANITIVFYSISLLGAIIEVLILGLLLRPLNFYF